MVLNLTDPILNPILNASINATIYQPSQPSGGFDWMTSFSSLLGVIVGGFVTYYASIKLEEKKFEINERAKRRETYSRLRGVKSSLTEHVSSCLQEYILSREYTIFNDIEPTKENYEERERAWKEHQKLKLELSKVNQNFHEIVSQIYGQFPESADLNAKIKSTENFDDLVNSFIDKEENELTSITESKDKKKTKDWADSALQRLNSLVKDQIEHNIDELSNHLLKQIK